MVARLGKISPTKPVVSQIYANLRAAILRTDLAPGTLISETEIGLQMGASRTPVRAALAQLQDEGLIETRPSRGNYVTLISSHRIRAAHFLRDAIEGATVTLLASNPLPSAVLAQLEGNLAASAACIALGDSAGFSALDDEFHSLLADATGYSHVATALNREKLVLDRLRVLSLTNPDHLLELLADHRAIVAAIVAGNTAAAQASMRLHLSRVLATLNDLKQRNHEYFI